MDPLLTSLLDLLRELDSRGVSLTVGGGFGLYLKRLHLETSGERTLFVELPGIRSTNDIDLFLHTEVIANLDRTRLVAEAIKKLEYQVVPGAEYLQWRKPVVVAEVEQEVRVDVLVGPLGEERSKIKVNNPRVRPKGDVQFHAHLVEEALRYRGTTTPSACHRPHLG